MAESPLIQALRGVFTELDEFIVEHNRQVFETGGLRIPALELKIAGQTALFLAELPFPITATTDLDIVVDMPYPVLTKLRDLLKKLGIVVDPDGRLVWMPEGTVYHPFFSGSKLKVSFADPEAVMLSKYKFNRPDDRNLIRTYLQYFPGFQKRIEASGLKRK